MQTYPTVLTGDFSAAAAMAAVSWIDLKLERRRREVDTLDRMLNEGA
jgi:hypothetical protein